MDVQPLIQRRTEACQDLFKEFVATYPADEWFENRQADFQLWSSGLGASVRGKASLDHRVKDHPKTRDMICDYLDGLKELLQRHLRPYQDRLTRVDSDDVDHDLFLDPTSDSFIESRLAVKSILLGLTRISSNIRRAGTKYRFKAADDQFDESQLQDAKRMYVLHIYREQGSSRQRIRSQQEGEIQRTGPSADETSKIALSSGWITAVQAHLVKANLLRHNRILYNTRNMRNKPVVKLYKRYTAAPAPRTLELAENTIDPRLHGQIPSIPKPKDGPLSESGETNSASVMQTATDIGSQYDENSAFKKPTPSLFTQGTRTGALLEYPRCPKPTVDGMLQCPYCGDVLSYEYFKNKSRWRGHVAQDLLPYSCVVQDCHYSDEMYGTSAGFSDHILKEHSGKIWTCPHCNSLPTTKEVKMFESEDEWRTHMSQTHGGAFPAHQLPLLSKLSTRTITPSLQCPLCQPTTDETTSDIEHIAQCLHRFALLALPPYPDNLQDPDDDDLKSNSDRAVMIDENSSNYIEHTSSNEEMQDGSYSDGRELDEVNAAIQLTSEALLEVPTKLAADNMETWNSLVSPEEPITAVEPELTTDVEHSALVEVTHRQSFTSSRSSLSSDEMDDGFVNKLLQSLIVSVFDRKDFLPEGLIKTLITDDAVIQQCGFVNLHNQPEEQKLLRFVTFEAKKVFAICLLTGFESKDLHRAMSYFMELGFNDSSLPITNDIMLRIPFFGSTSSRPRKPWTRLKVRSFCEYQWEFLAPVFSTFTNDMELQPQHILPFTSMSDEVLSGSLNQVYQVTVHASHFWYAIPKEPDRSFDVALKVMRRIYTGGENDVVLDERQWQRSVTAHREIGSLNHPNIIWFVAAITRGDDRYLMYEWADAGSLQNYWKNHKRPVLSAGFIKAITQQLRGLADALENLHNYSGGSYRHGDLKPSKILLVKGRANYENHFDIGVLKLAGFNFAKHHTIATELRPPTSMRYTTKRYEPPEAVTIFNQGRSRRYDIWSMGCIILEFIIWAVFGYEGLISFESRLVGDLGEPIPYYIIEDTSSGKVAKVHPEADAIMDVLAEGQAHANRSALLDLLQLVRTKLLVVNLGKHYQKQPEVPTVYPIQQQLPSIFVIGPDELHDDESSDSVRADAGVLRDALDEIIRRGESNGQYWLTEEGGNKTVPLRLPSRSKPKLLQVNDVTDPGDTAFTRIQRQKLQAPGSYPSQQQDARKPTSLEEPSQDHPQEKLSDQLFSAHVPTVSRTQGFLPRGALSKILTESRVREALAEALGPHSDEKAIIQISKMICQEVDTEADLSKDPIEPVRRSFQKLFATLVLIEKAGDIGRFIDENVTDSDLPLLRVPSSAGSNELGLARYRQPDKLLQCCQQWSQLAIRNFEEWQWSMLSPFFGKSEDRRHVKHYNLRDQVILPFVTVDSSESSALQAAGGFGSVFKVDIHPDNHNFGQDSQEPATSFAIKRLRTQDKDTFRREVEMLKKFSDNAHPHLISLLATYEQSGVFNLIFPWARSDLMGYWRSINPRPQFDAATVLWVAEQCGGIADGVMRIHQHDSSESLSSLASKKQFMFGSHGDIKPENVLWFPDPGASSRIVGGTLKLSDFGLADFKDEEAKPASSGAVSLSYRAPESDLPDFRPGRSYDMWTLGCLYLEFITWLLGGWQLVNEFANRRLALDKMWFDLSTDTFFEVILNHHGTNTVLIKPVVTEFIQQLHSHQSCSDFIHDFLSLISLDLLVILTNDPWTRGRTNSGELNVRLAMMVRKCHSDIDYACKSIPWESLSAAEG